MAMDPHTHARKRANAPPPAHAPAPAHAAQAPPLGKRFDQQEVVNQAPAGRGALSTKP